MTADRGYGKHTFFEQISEVSLGSLFDIPGHFRQVLPFFAASYLKPTNTFDFDEEKMKEGVLGGARMETWYRRKMKLHNIYIGDYLSLLMIVLIFPLQRLLLQNWPLYST